MLTVDSFHYIYFGGARKKTIQGPTANATLLTGGSARVHAGGVTLAV